MLWLKADLWLIQKHYHPVVLLTVVRHDQSSDARVCPREMRERVMKVKVDNKQSVEMLAETLDDASMASTLNT